MPIFMIISNTSIFVELSSNVEGTTQRCGFFFKTENKSSFISTFSSTHPFTPILKYREENLGWSGIFPGSAKKKKKIQGDPKLSNKNAQIL